MATINTLKNWFRTGSKPTQAQFWAWLDSFRHKDEAVPAADISGLQELLDGKVDKKELVPAEQVGPYNATKNYIFDAQAAEYVSFANPSSAIPQFQVEGFYRLAESASPGENPETHPDHWVYQGTVLGDIAIDDVNGLREELNWMRENVGGKEITYSIDFGINADVAQEVNMVGVATITQILAVNVSSLFLTWSGGVRQQVTPGVVAISIAEGDVLTWEVERNNETANAVVGVELIKI